MNLTFFLAGASLTLILQSGRIFEPVRKLLPPGVRRFVACPLCLGFWTGIVLALAWHWGHLPLPIGFHPVALFSTGLVNAIVSYLVASVFHDDGIHLR